MTIVLTGGTDAHGSANGAPPAMLPERKRPRFHPGPAGHHATHVGDHESQVSCHHGRTHRAARRTRPAPHLAGADAAVADAARHRGGRRGLADRVTQAYRTRAGEPGCRYPVALTPARPPILAGVSETSRSELYQRLEALTFRDEARLRRRLRGL